MIQNSTVAIPLMRGWKFCLGNVKRWERIDHTVTYLTTKTGHELGDEDIFVSRNPWRDVILPHDWNTGQLSSPEFMPSNGFKPRGEGWYYTDVPLPNFGGDAFALLEFEGVMGECEIYVNGVLAVRGFSGYTAFRADISDYILPGQTARIAVHVDNSRWEGWWYEGAGIYRPVTLYLCPAVHLKHRSLFVNPVPGDAGWTVRISGIVENSGSEDARACIRLHTAFGDAGTEACIPAYGESPFEAVITAADPALWSPDSPVLYDLDAVLALCGEEIQRESVRFGFRKIEWTDHGMYLNGKPLPVHGICCHQDHVGVGIALNRSLLRMRVRRLKEMGCNALRCAHNCPSDDLLRACDELGLFVMAENRHLRSSEEVLSQVDEMALVCRNHPSVFLYSLFNEELWQSELRGKKITLRLLRRLKETDPTRAVTAAQSGGVLASENPSDVLDVAGINYSIGDYMPYAVRRPGHPMLATENGPVYATRGVYKNDAAAQVYDSYGLNWPAFGNELAETMEAVGAAPHVAGVFVWGGFEYRGEPQPFEWPSVFSHWGICDNCGFPKDVFWLLKSWYTDEPVLHLLPHWDHKPGETVRVCVFSNCDSAELFLNGVSLGRKPVIRRRAEWEVPFAAGRLSVTGSKDGVTVTDEVRTPGVPARLLAEDASEDADFDCSVINITLTDAQGVPLPGDATDRDVTFTVHTGRLVGAGNGDPNGLQPDVTSVIRTFHGKCQALVLPDAEGRVHVTVSAVGLGEAQIVRG